MKTETSYDLAKDMKRVLRLFMIIYIYIYIESQTTGNIDR